MARGLESKNGKISTRKLTFSSYCNCEFGVGGDGGVFLLWTVQLSQSLSAYALWCRPSGHLNLII